MRGLLGFLSGHSFRVDLEDLGAHRERILFHLQNLDLPCPLGNQGGLAFPIFLVGHVGLSAHPSTLAREHLGALGIPLDLEVQQILEGLAYQGRLCYKELCRLSDPSSQQDPSNPGGLKLLVDLSVLVGQEILCQEVPWRLLSPGGLVVQETLYLLGLHLHDLLGVPELPSLHQVHPNHVVHLALEILVAHQVLFLLCAL